MRYVSNKTAWPGGPTSGDGATPLCLLSSLASGDSLQRPAIISFQSAEEEGAFQRPHRGERDQLITIKKKDPNPRRPPSSCSTGVKSKQKRAHVSQVPSTCPDWWRTASHPQLPSPGWRHQNISEIPPERVKGHN